MIGYTRKVGLRKPGTWKWAIRNQVRPLDEALQIKVRAGSLCAAAGLMDTIRRAAATLDGLPSELRETMAHRTRVRKAQADCRHCACFMHAECCFCDGGQLHRGGPK